MSMPFRCLRSDEASSAPPGAGKTRISGVSAVGGPQADVLELDEKPKRPLSAYNLFFRDQRQLLLAALPAPAIGCKPKTSHGKINFKNMARTIAARWKDIAPEDKKEYERIAEVGRRKYKELAKRWKRQQAGEWKQQYSMLQQGKSSCTTYSKGNSKKSNPRNDFASQTILPPGSNNLESHQYLSMMRPIMRPHDPSHHIDSSNSYDANPNGELSQHSPHHDAQAASSSSWTIDEPQLSTSLPSEIRMSTSNFREPSLLQALRCRQEMRRMIVGAAIDGNSNIMMPLPSSPSHQDTIQHNTFPNVNQDCTAETNRAESTSGFRHDPSPFTWMDTFHRSRLAREVEQPMATNTTAFPGMTEEQETIFDPLPLDYGPDRQDETNGSVIAPFQW